jgi:hypothetical protein
MKKLIAILAMALMSLASFASETPDKMHKHSGETVDVKIVRVGEYNITYTYVGESAEQVVSKYAIEKIVYGSGRTEKVTDKISVGGEDDWENVIILEDKAQIAGLIKKDEISGKTSGLFSFQTFGSADKKAQKKLKQAAAKMGCPFILMSADKNNIETTQALKNGFAYSYK